MELQIEISGVELTRTYTIAEASRLTGKSASWLYDEARQGRLRCLDLSPSRARLVSGEEIIRYVTEVILGANNN